MLRPERRHQVAEWCTHVFFTLRIARQRYVIEIDVNNIAPVRRETPPVPDVLRERDFDHGHTIGTFSNLALADSGSAMAQTSHSGSTTWSILTFCADFMVAPHQKESQIEVDLWHPSQFVRRPGMCEAGGAVTPWKELA